MHPEPVDVILDAAGQKETGKWTLMAALDAGEPLPLIGEAVFACWPIRSKRTFNRCEDTERWGIRKCARYAGRALYYYSSFPCFFNKVYPATHF